MTVNFQYDGLVNTHHASLHDAITAFKNMISDFDISKLKRKVGEDFIPAVLPAGSELSCIDTNEKYVVTKSNDSITHYQHVEMDISGMCHTNEVCNLFKVKVKQ